MCFKATLALVVAQQVTSVRLKKKKILIRNDGTHRRRVISGFSHLKHGVYQTACAGEYQGFPPPPPTEGVVWIWKQGQEGDVVACRGDGRDSASIYGHKPDI